MDILFGNADEVCSLYEVGSFDEAISRVRSDCHLAAVTHGKDGAVIVAHNELVPVKAEPVDKVHTWPHLLAVEFVAALACTAFLFVFSVFVNEPLLGLANINQTPNPSKAPWYFLGLQEMLVYYDPWYAGVALPSMVVFGLMALPYLDFNKKGNGYYSIEERKFAYLTYQFGFLELWITLIILGTFLRGPNWNFFGPFEYWDAHKVLAQNNVDLSQYFWNGMLGQALPKAAPGSSVWAELGYILLRESPGIILTLAYLVILPPILAATIFRSFFVKMGLIRYMIMSNLLLLMISLPLNARSKRRWHSLI